MEQLIKGFPRFVNETTLDDERLEQLYQKIVNCPNKDDLNKSFIKCPECGEEILMIPTLRVMNSAIENHVHMHKVQLKTDPTKEHQKAINIQLALVEQVLQKACRFQTS